MDRRFAGGPQQSLQQTSRIILAALIIIAALWVLRSFFAPLGWAVVLAIATWPLYQRLRGRLPASARKNLAPFLFTLAITLVFVAPLLLAVGEMGRELNGLVQYLRDINGGNVAPPPELERLPWLGGTMSGWWRANLMAQGAVSRFVHFDTGTLARVTQLTAIFFAHMFTFFVVTVLTLFFLFRDGEHFGRKVQVLARRALGRKGLELCYLMVFAVRGTSDGVVLVGLGVGLILGIGYFFTGVPHPALLGLVTAILAMIPFGGPFALGAACLLLVAKGSTGLAIGLVAFGSAVIFVADHILRPVLIGGNAKLPFLWVFLGIFAGLATFGILGLFLGPALMVALVSLWREWTEPRRFHASLRLRRTP